MNIEAALLAANHVLFKSRTDYGIFAGREAAMREPTTAKGYLLGLEVAAGVCRSHIVSAAKKFGTKSGAVRIGRADLCCIEREIRRVKRILNSQE